MIECFAPTPELGDLVEGFWASWNNTADTTHLLPDGRVDIVLELCEGARSAAIYGSVSAPVQLPVKRQTSYVGVRFRPGRARHFIEPTMANTSDAVITDAAQLRFATLPALEACTLQGALTALNCALLQFKRAAVPAEDRVDRMIDLAVQSRGATTAGELASTFGISLRQVERDFHHALGMAPKAFLGIQRFLFARSLLHQGTPPALAAIDAGYNDQSHLNRDMRRLSGQTPARCGRTDVEFLQDRTAPAWDHAAFQP